VIGGKNELFPVRRLIGMPCAFSEIAHGTSNHSSHKGKFTMLYWAAVFLVIALVSGVLGFGLIAGPAIYIAKVLFFIFVILFLLSLVFGVIRRGPTI
jgi:uncharacterized membrane protein YtjA (UPF0391 family)